MVVMVMVVAVGNTQSDDSATEPIAVSLRRHALHDSLQLLLHFLLCLHLLLQCTRLAEVTGVHGLAPALLRRLHLTGCLSHATSMQCAHMSASGERRWHCAH